MFAKIVHHIPARKRRTAERNAKKKNAKTMKCFLSLEFVSNASLILYQFYQNPRVAKCQNARIMKGSTRKVNVSNAKKIHQCRRIRRNVFVMNTKL